MLQEVFTTVNILKYMTIVSTIVIIVTYYYYYCYEQLSSAYPS